MTPYKEYWIEPNGRAYCEKVDGLDEDSVHVVEMSAYTELQCRVNKLIAALTYGGGSIREELALMVEGEGSNPDVYMAISKHALTKLDRAIKEFQGEEE